MSSMKERLMEVAQKKYDESLAAFERRCNLPKTTIYKMGGGLSSDNIAKILDACPDVDAYWLLGVERKEEKKRAVEQELMLTTLVGQPKPKSIPLLPFSAVGGFLSENNHESFTDTTYSIQFPDFSERGADCAIRVEGDSMYPRYSNGDVLAIKILRDPSFFQWGRVYVLNTAQGCVVKRLFPDPDDSEGIVCRSEDSVNYPDYKVSKSDVIGVALVVGHAGIE